MTIEEFREFGWKAGMRVKYAERDTDSVRQAVLRAYFMGMRHGAEINVEAVRALQYKANRDESNSTWREEL